MNQLVEDSHFKKIWVKQGLFIESQNIVKKANLLASSSRHDSNFYRFF